MARRHIGQREAHALEKRVRELEAAEERRRSGWAQDWPFGTNICSAKWEQSDLVPVAIRTARRLKHAVVAIADDTGRVSFYALPVAAKDA